MQYMPRLEPTRTTSSMAGTRCSQHQPLKNALCTICRAFAALASSSLPENVCVAPSADASCATLLPWMPANRNGDVRSQVCIANRNVLSTACAADRFLLVGLPGGAAGATPAPSACNKGSLSPSVASSYGGYTRVRVFLGYE